MDIELKVTKVFRRNQTSKAQIIINRGGTGSSKSYSVLQLIIYKMLTEHNKKTLVMRKTGPSLNLTTKEAFKSILRNLDIYNLVKEEKQHNNFIINGNLVHFDSLDDPSKKKSSDWNYIIFEEANEFSFDDFRIIKLYLRAPSKDGARNQIFIMLNPVDEYCWVKVNLIDTDAYDYEEIVSTYKDNPYLPKEIVKDIEALERQDHNFANIYAKGMWGKLDNIIYSNYEVVQEIPKDPDDIIYGLDFGFNNPSALTRISFCREKVYEEELLYLKGLINQELIVKLKELIPPEDQSNKYIFCDCAEPARIKEIQNAGFLAMPCLKDKNSVVDGINRVKSVGTIYILNSSINLLKEKRGYSWKKTKDGRVIDDPIKFLDHLMDAERMAIYTYDEEYRGGNGFGGFG